MKYSECVEDGVLTIGLLLSEEEYLLWQRSLEDDESRDVYFEFNDQINGSYNCISEISIMRDGIHLVKTDGGLEHFYFDKEFDDYKKLVEGLQKIYSSTPKILDVVDR